MTEDILERAKEYREAMRDNPDMPFAWEIIDGLIAEVERLRSLENCVSLVIDRQGKTNAAQLGQLDVISAYLDAELVEWKNGDQIAEIAIKFMDLQKQKLNDANSQIAAKDARIADQEAYIERLEVAFLRSNAAMRYYQEGNRGPWPQVGEQFKEPYIQKAREALEQIKAETGSGDHVAGANKLILTAEQREEEGKRDA